MVKFSVLGRKRRRRSNRAPSLRLSSDEDADDDLRSEEELEEEDEREDEGRAVEVGGIGGGESSSGKESRGDLITVMIDPDSLDCPICFEPLSPPVFQCSNGHIACSSCCIKMKNKCHSCCSSLGCSRCLALEKVLESIRITCPNVHNGCQESVIYAQSNAHKETCIYSPCSCPFPDCNYEGSVQQLSLHFIARHGDTAISFEYSSSFGASLDRNKTILFFHGNDGVLYLLDNKNCVSVGCFITLTAIQPTIQKGNPSYELIARSGGSSLQLKASLVSTKRWTGVSPSKEFLLIPHDFFDGQGMLQLEACIHKGQT